MSDWNNQPDVFADLIKAKDAAEKNVGIVFFESKPKLFSPVQTCKRCKRTFLLCIRHGFPWYWNDLGICYDCMKCAVDKYASQVYRRMEEEICHGHHLSPF